MNELILRLFEACEPQLLTIKAPNGETICQLLIQADENADWGNVDVIISADKYQGTFMAFKDGQKVVHESPDTGTFATDIRRKD